MLLIFSYSLFHETRRTEITKIQDQKFTRNIYRLGRILFRVSIKKVKRAEFNISRLKNGSEFQKPSKYLEGDNFSSCKNEYTRVLAIFEIQILFRASMSSASFSIDNLYRKLCRHRGKIICIRRFSR